jgi:hypothetical protein
VAAIGRRPDRESDVAGVGCYGRLSQNGAVPAVREIRSAATRVFHETIRGSVLDDAHGLVVLKPLAAFEEQQLDQERQANDLAV